jgi:hypothetical protein
MRLPLFLLGCLTGGAAAFAPAVAATPEYSAQASWRTRYETLHQPVARNARGSDQLLASQVLLDFRAQGAAWRAEAEFIDARTWLDDAGTPLGTDDVNTLDVLRAELGWRATSRLRPGDALDLSVGRFTLDLGSRRLVARNQFRNSINAFTGVQAQWAGADGTHLRAFATLPVLRTPEARARLDRNAGTLDTQSFDTVLSGFIGETTLGDARTSASLYLYVLDEADGHKRSTRDRQLYTPGLRLHTPPAPGRWDGELELVAQFGHVRADLAADARRLTQCAGFAHAHLGRSFALPLAPRVAVSAAYASGDDHPKDGRNSRFDTLFGARRFDYGPTGIFGPFTRANLVTPGLRLDLHPHSRIESFVGYRAAWLARTRDALDGADLVDPSGASGRFIGHQVEFRVRYDAWPGHLHLEVGGAHLWHGGFLRNAPGAPREGDSTYLYLQTTLRY